jgi:Arc/MetJ-type ribon-helix-helix transcriptional regulator
MMRFAMTCCLLASACGNSKPDDLHERNITLVIEREEVNKLATSEPVQNKVTTATDAAAPKPAAAEEPGAKERRGSKAKKATSAPSPGTSAAGEKVSYSAILQHRNRMKALMYSVGLLPGDWPAIDTVMRQIDRLISEGEYASAAQLIADATHKIETFRLSKTLLESKLERARKTTGGKEGTELQAIAGLVGSGQLDVANERLNRLFAKYSP